MSESTLRNKLRKAIRKEYLKAFVWKISDRFTSGIPDTLVIIEGVHTFFELKAPNKKPEGTPIQKYQIRKINEAGGYAFVSNNFDVVMKILEERRC